jgi:hypothetical protein
VPDSGRHVPSPLPITFLMPGAKFVVRANATGSVTLLVTEPQSEVGSTRARMQCAKLAGNGACRESPSEVPWRRAEDAHVLPQLRSRQSRLCASACRQRTTARAVATPACGCRRLSLPGGSCCCTA